MITYDNLTWVNNDLDLFHAVNLQIDDTNYGEQIIGIQTNVGQQLLTHINDNDIILPVETEVVSEDVSLITDDEMIKRIQVAVQSLLDSKAQEKLYDDGFAIASYANSTIESFRNEALLFIAWRDACWAKCYEILALYQSGQIERPDTTYVLERLPVLSWDEIENQEVPDENPEVLDENQEEPNEEN